jgi:hypothetical protein
VLDHERIDELLAGYVLRSLSGEDAAEANRLLAEHVPSCLACRQTLAGLQSVAGDLALDADPVAPPEPALARIHRAMERVPLSGGGGRRGAFVGFAASAVALVALGGLTFTMASRASQAEDRADLAIELASVMASPGVRPVNVDPQGETPSDSRFVQVSAADIRRVYLIAEFCPDPSPGHEYQLWLGSEGRFTPVGGMFRPENGVVLLELVVDVSVYDEVWITEELAGTRPAEPRAYGGRSWRGSLV